MSTIIMNCFCDSIIAKVLENLTVCCPEAAEKGTNCADVWIVGLVCLTFVAIAFIAKSAVLGWKERIISAVENERDAQKEKEKEEHVRKLKNNLLDKYLDFLKEKVISSNTDAEKKYLQALAYLIEKSQKGEMATITLEELMGEAQKESLSEKS
jgi:hypothetical protein